MTLTQRLALVFAVLLVVCSGTSAWLQLRSNRMLEQEVVQGLSRDVAASIARELPRDDAGMPKGGSLRGLFDRLMMVNPSVEVYLLDPEGRIVDHAAPAGRLRRDRVGLAPVRRLLAGEPLPILGDDPRSLDARKVFSAAPLTVDGREVGLLYVVLLGEARDLITARGSADAVLKTALWSIALVAVLCLAAGLVAFRLITRPLRRLTDMVQRFDIDAPPRLGQGIVVDEAAARPAAASGPGRGGPNGRPWPGGGDEIALLDRAYHQMVERIGEQWRDLGRQDRDRRELIAAVSHDLRTPLSSLHGFLETLLLKDASLSPEERRRYLSVALEQSGKVGALAASLFELARLEYGFVQPEREPFSMTDLIQDVFQRFELAAESKGVRLTADFPPRVPAVDGDLGMIERVLVNLLDNGLRHTPAGGSVAVSLAPRAGDVRVTVADTGSGIDRALRPGLFERPFDVGGARRGGGLGLRIVHRMLALHGSRIELVDDDRPGARFTFVLPQAGPPRQVRDVASAGVAPRP